MVYLDHNASSPLLPVARAAWLEAEERWPGNPSSQHRLGARAERALEEARVRVGAILGRDPDGIMWTSGATEACNTVLRDAAARDDGTQAVWISAVEHPAVVAAAHAYFGGRVVHIPVDRNGVTDVAWVEERLARERPGLVAVMAANNETGVIQPWRRVHELCVAREVAFFSDATQWCGRIAAVELGRCEFVAGSAHKFGGPRGVGFLAVPPGGRLHPLMHGGKQQEGRRAGTENVAGVCAMAAGLDWCEQQIKSGAEVPLRQARDVFAVELRRKFPAARINGEGCERLWNTLSVVMPEVDCRQRWVVKLDKAGFAVSTGSACASGAEKPSPVLSAMGLSAEEAARALRFSAGWLTPPEAWENLLHAVVRIQEEIGVAAAGR